MAEIFKLPVDGRDMDFHCGTYATEKTLETLGISLSGLLVAFEVKFSSTIRHFIYFSAYDAQRLKTPKGHPVDFPHDLEDTYQWLEEWGGGNTKTTETFTRQLLKCIYGEEGGKRMAMLLIEGKTIEEITEGDDKKKVTPEPLLTGAKTS